MTILFMSDGRQFTDYTSSALRTQKYMKEYSVNEPKTLRYKMQSNANNIMKTNATDNKSCTNQESNGMTVMCGKPIANYFINRN